VDRDETADPSAPLGMTKGKVANHRYVGYRDVWNMATETLTLSDETNLNFVIPTGAEESAVFSPVCFVFRDRQVGFSAIDVPGLE
jgi:hypothetical protein